MNKIEMMMNNAIWNIEKYEKDIHIEDVRTTKKYMEITLKGLLNYWKTNNKLTIELIIEKSLNELEPVTFEQETLDELLKWYISSLKQILKEVRNYERLFAN